MSRSVVRKVLEHFPVGGEDPGPGNKSQVFSILKDRNVIAPAFRELPGHLFHLVSALDGPFGSDHQVTDLGSIIHLLVEHDVPDIVQFHNTLQVVLFIHHRINIPAVIW